MGLLKRRATGGLHNLSSRYVVGRSPASNLHLASRLASSTHAEILWNGSSWELRDLGSRNGTFLGARRLEIGERVIIRRGTRIAFGEAEDLFELVDDGPPGAVAASDDGQRQEAEDGLLILPDPEQPVFTIFNEGGGQWVAESSDGTRQRLSDGDTLDIDGQRWRIELPVVSELTWQPGAAQMVLRRLTMRFAVSRDEEQVELTLIQGNQVVVLPSRTHYYLLLTLARARLDAQASVDVTEAEAGWVHVSDLLDMLKTSESTLNVAICRARKDLARAEVLGATELIERHPVTRRLRLGVGNIEILAL
jgi:pSer/pThr/pTyr-binding forkhead associated (FHA) protein